jgi:hypothetical protein
VSGGSWPRVPTLNVLYPYPQPSYPNGLARPNPLQVDISIAKHPELHGPRFASPDGWSTCDLPRPRKLAHLIGFVPRSIDYINLYIVKVSMMCGLNFVACRRRLQIRGSPNASGRNRWIWTRSARKKLTALFLIAHIPPENVAFRDMDFRVICMPCDMKSDSPFDSCRSERIRPISLDSCRNSSKSSKICLSSFFSLRTDFLTSSNQTALQF